MRAPRWAGERMPMSAKTFAPKPSDRDRPQVTTNNTMLAITHPLEGTVWGCDESAVSLVHRQKSHLGKYAKLYNNFIRMFLSIIVLYEFYDLSFFPQHTVVGHLNSALEHDSSSLVDFLFRDPLGETAVVVGVVGPLPPD